MKKPTPYRWNLITVAKSVLCVFITATFMIAAPPPTLAEEPASAPDRPEEYLIGAGDVLEIVVWREEEISRTVRVRPDGKISLPLVDDIRASDNTLLQLKKRITETLAAYVEQPSVYVMLQENRSKKIYMVGKINSPGEYPLEKDITVLQAIAKAGGFDEWAEKDDIIIVRKGLESPGNQVLIKFDYDRVVSGKDIKQNILLHPEDVIIVP